MGNAKEKDFMLAISVCFRQVKARDHPLSVNLTESGGLGLFNIVPVLLGQVRYVLMLQVRETDRSLSLRSLYLHFSGVLGS